MTTELIKTFPEGKATHQPAPTDNHLLWNIGHLANTYQWATGLISGEKGSCPESFNPLFGGKSKPTPDAKTYPSLTEVKKHFDAEYNRFVTVAEKLPDAELSKSIADKTGGFAKDGVDLINKMAWHDGWHSGQISSLRRSLNLPPVMG